MTDKLHKKQPLWSAIRLSFTSVTNSCVWWTESNPESTGAYKGHMNELTIIL